MIWTTTPWTLAANLAVALHPRLEYVTLDYQLNGRTFRLRQSFQTASPLSSRLPD